MRHSYQEPEMISKQLEDNFAMLHILRNPHGWSDESVRDIRNKAAAELERLWALERKVKLVATWLKCADWLR